MKRNFLLHVEKLLIMPKKSFITEHNVLHISKDKLEKYLNNVFNDPNIEVSKAWFSEEDGKLWLECDAENVDTLKDALDSHSMPFDRMHIIDKRWKK